LIKNAQPFGKKFQKTVGEDFFDSHCTYSVSQKIPPEGSWHFSFFSQTVENF